MPASPPRLAERLLQWCLRDSASAAYIVGDLRQDFTTLRERRGRVIASMWYWREVIAVGFRYVASPSILRDAGSDLRAAVRVFRSAPGFAFAVVFTLALGLGANATMFGAVDRILLSPPEHVVDHEDLRFVYHSGLGSRSINGPLSYSFPDYESIRDLPVLDGAAAYRPRRALTMGSGPDARRAILQGATAEFFPLLGVLPGHGRFFDATDDRAGAPPVAVLGHGFWDREFGQDPDVLGRTVTLGSHSYEVIGVAPKGFTGAQLESVDVWVPIRMNVPLTTSWEALRSRGAWWYRVIVRLGDGVSDEEAERVMTDAHTAGVTAAVEAGEGNLRNGVGATLHTGAFMMALGPNSDTDTAITLWLAGVSILVLLIACANVTNLMLARGIDRQRERAVRLAFGVSRRRLMTQALAEALVLATAGGFAALFVARWSGQALYGLMLPGIPLPESPVDLRLVAFVTVVVLLATVVAGMLPAVQAMRTAPGDVLRRSSRGATGGSRARDLLTLGQVSLSTVLLVGAGLFVQSLNETLRTDTGFDHDALVNVILEQERVDPGLRDQLHREARTTLRSLPGVDEVILSSSQRPLYGWDEQSSLIPSRLDSLPRLPDGGPYTYAGTEGYVETAGLRILQGRGFAPSDYDNDAPFALMVSRSFAEGAWPGLDPLRECVTLQRGVTELDGPEPCRPVVGVYEDLIVRSLGDEGIWSVTWPIPRDAPGLRGILVRVQGDPADYVQSIRDRLTTLSSEIRYVHVLPMSDRIDRMRGSWKVGATLFSVFGLLALVVASLGLYSVLAFAVARRSREIGIRSALGAQRWDLVSMVVRRAARLIGIGLVVGVLLAALMGRSLEAVLFGVPAVNPMVFSLVAIVLIGAGLAAAWIPAWNATAIDPVGAMAAE